MVCWLLQCSTALWGSLDYPHLGLIGVSPFRDHLDFFGLAAFLFFSCARHWRSRRPYAVTLPGLASRLLSKCVGLPGRPTWSAYLVGLPGRPTWSAYLVGLSGRPSYLVGLATWSA
jgi:hypothetical protein